MDERVYFAAQERKSEAKVAWEYGRLFRLVGQKPPQGRWVLDAGCGAGPGLRIFSHWGNRVLGLDRSFYALQRARQQVLEAGLVQADLAAGLPFAEGSFDWVLLGDVLEHVDQGEHLLSECWRVLRPGGILLVRTVNRWDIRRFFLGQRWSGIADPGHVRLYSPPELRRAFQVAGFSRVRVQTGVKPLFWLPLRWPIGFPAPPLLGNGLVGAGWRT